MREHKEVILKNIGIEPIPSHHELLDSILFKHKVKLDFVNGSPIFVLSEHSVLKDLFKEIQHWVRVIPGSKVEGLSLLEKDLSSLDV